VPVWLHTEATTARASSHRWHPGLPINLTRAAVVTFRVWHTSVLSWRDLDTRHPAVGSVGGVSPVR
jgi:hypothetical protein